MHAHALNHAGQREPKIVASSGLFDRYSFAELIGPDDGSVHLQIGHVVLGGGGSVQGHLHAYEESFLMLEGTAWLRLNGSDIELQAGDFGVVPMGVGHSWRNPTGTDAKWLRVRAPQPRNVHDELEGTYAQPDIPLPAEAVRPKFGLPSLHHIGHFSLDQMPPPGPIAIRGTNNYGVRNVSVRLLVDDTNGARQHIMFAGLMEPDIARVGETPPPHYHAFEEVYYFTGGAARGFLEGKEYQISAGDVAFAGVNATHAFVPIGNEPLRWIEIMAPRPPGQNSMIFVNQWKAMRGDDHQ